MSITNGGSIGVTFASASGNTLAFTPAGDITAGTANLLIGIAADNVGTGDGDNAEISGIADDAGGNTYAELVEWTNGEGLAAAGSTCGLYLCRLATTLTTFNTITITFANSIADRCASLWQINSTTALSQAAAAQKNLIDAANGFGSAVFADLPSLEYCFFRVGSKEANSTTALTVSSGFTAITGTRSRNNAAAQLIRGEFIITTGTGATSNPAFAVSGDASSVFVALQEGTPAGSGHPAAARHRLMQPRGFKGSVGYQAARQINEALRRAA